MTSIFINYRRDDSRAYVGRIRDHLEKVYDPNKIFLDVNDIKGGEDYTSLIEATIKRCKCCIVVIGPNWHRLKKHGNIRLNETCDFVRWEITLALKYGLKIVPLLVGNAKMPDENELIDPLKGLTKFNALNISDERFSYDMERLINSIGGATGTIQFFIHKSMKLSTTRSFKRWVGLSDYLLVLDGACLGKLEGPIQVKEGIHKIQILEGRSTTSDNKSIEHISKKYNIPESYSNEKKYIPESCSNELRFRIKGGQIIKIFLAEHQPKYYSSSRIYIDFYKPIAEL